MVQQLSLRLATFLFFDITVIEAEFTTSPERSTSSSENSIVKNILFQPQHLMVKILLKYDRIRNFIYVLDIENIIASQHCNQKKRKHSPSASDRKKKRNYEVTIRY